VNYIVHNIVFCKWC